MTPPVAFRQAVLTEVLNPKTALFFLSSLPEFADPARGAAWAQLLVLGAIFVAMSIAYTALLALGAASVAGWLTRHSAIGRWKGRFVGSIYIGLGVQLALQERRKGARSGADARPNLRLPQRTTSHRFGVQRSSSLDSGFGAPRMTFWASVRNAPIAGGVSSLR